jgi:hypothetical protein
MTDYRKFNDANTITTTGTASVGQSTIATKMTTIADYQCLDDGVYKQRQQQQQQQKRNTGSKKDSAKRRKFSTIYNEDCDDDSDDDYFHIPHPRPEYYMTESMIDKIQNDSSLTEYDIMVIQRLACRKFHVPGNSFIEDYLFWFRNNHIMFSFCYADPRHPFGKRERVINLISSLAFGLAATCCVVLYFHYHASPNAFNKVWVSLFDTINVSTGMVVLFVFRYDCITCIRSLMPFLTHYHDLTFLVIIFAALFQKIASNL